MKWLLSSIISFYRFISEFKQLARILSIDSFPLLKITLATQFDTHLIIIVKTRHCLFLHGRFYLTQMEAYKRKQSDIGYKNCFTPPRGIMYCGKERNNFAQKFPQGLSLKYFTCKWLVEVQLWVITWLYFLFDFIASK